MKDRKPEESEPDPNYPSDHLFCTDIHKQVEALLNNPEYQQPQAYLRFTMTDGQITKKQETIIRSIKLAMQAIAYQPYDVIKEHLNKLCEECKASKEMNISTHLDALLELINLTREDALQKMDVLNKLREAIEAVFSKVSQPSLFLRTFMSWFEGLTFHLSLFQFRQYIQSMLNTQEESKKELVPHPDRAKQKTHKISLAKCEAINFIASSETEHTMPVVIDIMLGLLKETPEISPATTDALIFGVRMLHEGDESQCRLQIGASSMGEYVKKNQELILRNFDGMANKVRLLELDSGSTVQFDVLHMWLTGLCVRTANLGAPAKTFFWLYSSIKVDQLAEGYRTICDLLLEKIKLARFSQKSAEVTLKRETEAEAGSASASAAPAPLSLTEGLLSTFVESLLRPRPPLPISEIDFNKQLLSVDTKNAEFKIASLETALERYSLSKRQTEQLGFLVHAILIELKAYQLDLYTTWVGKNAHHDLTEQIRKIINVLRIQDARTAPDKIICFIRTLIALLDLLKKERSQKLLARITGLLLRVHTRLKSVSTDQLDCFAPDEARFLDLLGLRTQTDLEKMASLQNAIYHFDLSQNLHRALGRRWLTDTLMTMQTYFNKPYKRGLGLYRPPNADLAAQTIELITGMLAEQDGFATKIAEQAKIVRDKEALLSLKKAEKQTETAPNREALLSLQAEIIREKEVLQALQLDAEPMKMEHDKAVLLHLFQQQLALVERSSNGLLQSVNKHLLYVCEKLLNYRFRDEPQPAHDGELLAGQDRLFPPVSEGGHAGVSSPSPDPAGR